MSKFKKFEIIIMMIIIISSILLVILLLYLIYDSILYPTYLSTIADCYPNKATQILNNSGYVIAGQASINTNKPTTINNNTNYTINTKDLKINYDSKYLTSTIIKHENCHIDQFVNNRFGSCSKIHTIFISELECYITQHLNYKIYSKIYPIYKTKIILN